MRHAAIAFLDARTIRAINQRSRYADALRDVPRDLLPFMPLGFGYTIEHGLVAWSRLDGVGLPHGPTHYPDHLSPYGLFDAGLISESEYDLGSLLAARHRDGASSDSAGDGGSCGASCGGGCGGGD